MAKCAFEGCGATIDDSKLENSEFENSDWFWYEVGQQWFCPAHFDKGMELEAADEEEQE
jgi:hypothetical protein